MQHGYFHSVFIKLIQLLLALSTVLVWGKARAQFPDDSVANRYWQSTSAPQPQQGLFVHLDKTVYTNNEQIWFSAYFLHSTAPANAQQEFVAVSLISPFTRGVYLEAKFIAKSGFCFGNLYLPDTIPPGNYLFTAFGNVTYAHGKPVAVYQQLITIHSVVKNNFKASRTIIDSPGRQETCFVKVTATDLLQQPLKKVQVQFMPDGKKLKTAFTNDQGQAILAIPKQSKSAQLQMRLSYDNEFQLLSATIPALQADSSLRVRFFPESGQLRPGIPCKLLMEVTTAAGKPFATTAILYRNGTVADTLVTNSSGLSVFSVVPMASDTFYVLLPAAGHLANHPFNLPAPAADAVVISTDRAVFQDTLSCYLSTTVPRNVLLLVHTPEQLIVANRISINHHRKKIVIPFNPAEVPRGLCTVTIIDTMGNLLAERWFFGHQPNPIPFIIQTNKRSYTRHERVQLTLGVQSTFPDEQVIVSVAVVQSSRLSGKRRTDIEDYKLFHSRFLNIPPVAGRAISNSNYLEQVLLRGPLSGTNSQSDLAGDTALINMQLTGTLTIDNKKVKVPTTLLLFPDSNMVVLETDSNGVFVIPQQLVTNEGRPVTAVLSKDRGQSFTVQMNRFFTETANHLAVHERFEYPEPASTEEENTDADDEMSGIKRLKEIVIQANRNPLYSNSKPGLRINACGDYVCSFSVLNCENHFNHVLNRAPRHGDMVRIAPNLDILVPYTACSNERYSNANKIQLKAFYSARPFIGVEQEQKDQAEPEYRSTLLWKPGVLLDPGKDLQLNFLTSDITGSFEITIQGITASGRPIFQQGFFIVEY